MNAPTPIKQIAEAIDYQSLQDGLRARAADMGISRRVLDEISGLGDGYSAKLLCGRPTRIFGIVSLGLILQSLGVKIILVEDPEATARTITRMGGDRRRESQAVEGARHWRNAPDRTAMLGAEHRLAQSAQEMARELGRKVRARAIPT
jgi:hypothetical protein